MKYALRVEAIVGVKLHLTLILSGIANVLVLCCSMCLKLHVPYSRLMCLLLASGLFIES